MKRWILGLGVGLFSGQALAAGLTVGVVPSTLKVRPNDAPPATTSASIKAARNEFEAFQIVLGAAGSDVTQVSAKLAQPLAGPGGSIPTNDVVLYAEQYYD